jgi:hypothetical protein
MTTHPELPDDMDDRVLLAWLDAILSSGLFAFVSIDGLEELLRGARLASEAAFGHVLQNEADPCRGAGTLVVTAHASRNGTDPDLLRYAFETERLSLCITDGINFTLVRAAFRERTLEAAPDRADYARLVLDAVVRLVTRNHHWAVELPPDFAKAGGTQHAASRDAAPVREISSRHDRMDVLAFDAAIHFLFYKKIEQLELWQNGAAWFSDEARNAILHRMEDTLNS